RLANIELDKFQCCLHALPRGAHGDKEFARQLRSPMFHRVFAIAFVAVLLPLATLAQNAAPTKEPAKDTKDVPKVYVPGLEQFMNVILIEHNKLWFAAAARNWPLADYELGEIKEIMGDVQDHVPTFKSLPLAEMIDAVITKEVADLEKAVEAKDFKKFA